MNESHSGKWLKRVLALGMIVGVLTFMVAPNYMIMPTVSSPPFYN